MKTKPVIVFPTCWVYFIYLLPFIQVLEASDYKFHLGNQNDNRSVPKLPILYDSLSVDAKIQDDMVKSAFLALGVTDKDTFQPFFMDISQLQSISRMEAVEKTVQVILDSHVKVIVSLISTDNLLKFASIYDRLSKEVKENAAPEKLHIYTPRSFPSPHNFPDSVSIRSLQMSERASAVALLNRVRKVGVKTLIPVLDGTSSSQFDLLKLYALVGQQEIRKSWRIKFTKPIYLNDPTHTKKLKMILQKYNSFHEDHLEAHDGKIFGDYGKLNRSGELKPGVLLLAKKGSHLAMKIAAEKQHTLLSWFSPNNLDIEEWVQKAEPVSTDNSKDQKHDSQAVYANNAGQESDSAYRTAANNNLFGLYTVNFVGSKGWDNPVRRRVLRELAAFTGASPKILSAVLAYDAARLARAHLKNDLQFPILGLSGQIDFNQNGFRKSGDFLGSSLVPQTVPDQVTILQPSTWILEDITTLNDTKGNEIPQIIDYDVATSSVLTKDELVHIANSTRSTIGCSEHLMNIVTYDPFNQMPYHYFFTEANMPETIMVPNYLGFGITFICSHGTPSQNESIMNSATMENANDGTRLSTIQLACTPGDRMSQPVNCFRSHLNRRHKRAAGRKEEKTVAVPSVQYQYSFSGNDPWYSHDSKWGASKADTPSHYYYKPNNNRDYHVESVTYGYPTTRLDVPISEDPPSTPAPAPASKLPELRQILKAAKPFVGSCIGSSTGCAMCVLVLGRLPLGNNPTACTGPCFVGTFGSCGSLLGRVFAETTVICTELFRQGLIDVETFVADAEFGNSLATSSPYTMKGYTLLATPLVGLMKSSKFVTDIVATFALPWARHMKYLLGRSDETSILGRAVHMIGYPVCNVVGRLSVVFDSVTSYLSYLIILASPFFTLLVTIAFILLNINLGFVANHKRASNIVQYLTIVGNYFLEYMRMSLKRLTNYFKAIGRRT